MQSGHPKGLRINCDYLAFYEAYCTGVKHHACCLGDGLTAGREWCVVQRAAEP